MSEYQHYEFHAIDKPLNSEDLDSVREMSSRVQLSPRKAVFTYSYSDFRYDEEEVLVDYFDFMLYIANWGSKRIMMKFPPELVDYEFLRKYSISVISSYDQDIRIFNKSGYVILDISYSEEDGLGWIDEDDYGYDFLNIRSEIMKGDYRSLFIIWLRFLEDLYESGEFDLDYSFEPRLIPSDLLHISSSGYAAKEFYEVNQDWLDVMRSYSHQGSEKTIDYEAEILKMPKDKMIEYMQMILQDESNLKIRLIKELKGENRDGEDLFDSIKLLEIGEKAEKIKQERLGIEQKKKARKELEQMKNIRQNTDRIAGEIIENIEQGNSKRYKFALSKIMELKAMNDYFDTGKHFEVFLSQIVSRYSRKSAFIRMLKENNLVGKQ